MWKLTVNKLKNRKEKSRIWFLPLVLVSLLSASSIIHAGAIHDAAKAGDLDRVQKLVVNGADVNAKAARDETPLIYAALAGQGEIVNYLLQRGADINSRSAPGLTALHAAAYTGNTDIVSLLIAKGADINDASNRFRLTPLLAATEQNHIESVKTLLKHGADVTSLNLSGFNVTSEAGFREHWDVLRVLLANGAECQGIEKAGDWLYKECTSRANLN